MKRIDLLLILLLHITTCLYTTTSSEHSANFCQNTEDAAADSKCQSVGTFPATDSKKHEKEGADVLLLSDGAVYSGGVVDGRQEGRGREETPAGDRYDGEWEGGVKAGAGRYKWKDGRTYKGQSASQTARHIF